MSDGFECTAVVTCMGRLHQLKQSLPRLLDGKPGFAVVVDYSCPDGCGDWIEEDPLPYSRVSVVRSGYRARFHKAAALNLGLRYAARWGSWLCVLDADTMLRDGFWPWLAAHVERGRFYFMAGTPGLADVSGILVMHSEDYLASGGYDERFVGWGLEDWDMRARLHLQLGLPYSTIPAELVGALQHSDEERTRHYGEEKLVSYKRNWTLINANVREWTGRYLYELDARDVRPLFGGMW